MTYNAINELIASAEASGHDSFWEYDGEFFMLFYNRFRNTSFTDIPDIAFMYMEINNWQGMSVRCGVWQYYESGIHDYANERYQKNCDYPEEWFDETERIDEWISDNEGYIHKWMYQTVDKVRGIRLGFFSSKEPKKILKIRVFRDFRALL